MSLQTILSANTRQKIPESVLDVCLPNDRCIVENVLCAVQQLLPVVSAASAVVERVGKAYRISFELNDVSVALSDMRSIEAYSPSRIADIYVTVRSGAATLRIVVNDESAPVRVSEVDVVRVRKRVHFVA